MGLFTLKVDGIATGAVANTYKTVLGLKYANTDGHRGRLRECRVGPNGGAAQDLSVSLKIMIASNATDGTSTAVNTNTIGKHNPLQIGSLLAAIGKNYTVEPTNFGTDIIEGGDFNTRSTLILDWWNYVAPPVLWGKNQTLCILAAPGVATAATLGITLIFEEGV